MTLASQSKTLDMLLQNQYLGYSYSYPHKTAYRPFDSPRSISQLWHRENKDNLFCYIHIPFCEMRCGFCNLFTYSQPEESLTARYLEALKRQMVTLRQELEVCRIARIAIGGGTPTFLASGELDKMLNNLFCQFDITVGACPISLEASPHTLTEEKLRVIQQYQVSRISIGVQSFDTKDIGRMGRPQRNDEVDQSIELIRNTTTARLNIDLIYGADGQTTESWLASLRTAIRYLPEEIYLYPLYVRPLTGLSQIAIRQPDQRSELYRAGRDLLFEQGYRQVSMRMFERAGSGCKSALDYCCQRDGMIGLGCGARSYTSKVHYATSYAVRQHSILRIINDFVQQGPAEFRQAALGIELSEDDLKRRYLILSLLLAKGFDRVDYRQKFGSNLLDDFCQLKLLQDAEMVSIDEQSVVLTPWGLEWSDAIGPWLYSDHVRQLMEAYEWTG